MSQEWWWSFYTNWTWTLFGLSAVLGTVLSGLHLRQDYEQVSRQVVLVGYEQSAARVESAAPPHAMVPACVLLGHLKIFVSSTV